MDYEVEMETETSESLSRIVQLPDITFVERETQTTTQPGKESDNPKAFQCANCVDALCDLENANQRIESLSKELASSQADISYFKGECAEAFTRLENAEKEKEKLKENHQMIVDKFANSSFSEQEAKRLLETANNESHRLQQQLRNKNTCSKSCRQKEEHLKDVHAKDMQALTLDFQKTIQHKQHAFDEEMRTLQRCYQQVLNEKEELTLRLSKFASANLTYNNPNIADLSNPNRPTKLSEKFSELYDNQWTDAFEDLETEEECVKVKHLADILKAVYDYCTTVTSQQTNSMWENISSLQMKYEKYDGVDFENHGSNAGEVTSSEDNSIQSEVVRSQIKNHWSLDDKLSTEEKMTIDGIRKRMLHEMKAEIVKITKTERTLFIHWNLDDKLNIDEKITIAGIKKRMLLEMKAEVVKIITNSVANEFNVQTQTKITKYISECASVCWEMQIHEPKVHLQFVDVNDPMPFDGTTFKAYTHGGTLMDYVVWPPLYLHEGGPLLSKGVSQGK